MKIWVASLSFVIVVIAGFIFYFPKETRGSLPKEKSYTRVVALAPSFTETVIALGEGARLVGVTIHCEGPELKNIARIGSFAEPSFEAIIAQNPDLVLAVPHVMAQPVLDKLKENHIEVFAQKPDSLVDIKFIVNALGSKFAIPKKAETINREIDTAIEQAKAIVATLNFGGKKALIAVSHMPFVIAGKVSFPGEIIEALGLINMATDPMVPWPVWPLENLVTDPPQFLIVANGKEALPHFQKILTSLYGNASSMRLIVPDHPIFYSPSPIVAKDAFHLAHLLLSCT